MVQSATLRLPISCCEKNAMCSPQIRSLTFDANRVVGDEYRSVPIRDPARVDARVKEVDVCSLQEASALLEILCLHAAGERMCRVKKTWR